jgi:ABC-type glycerol-3-phosphate transport system substrate-binding protein
VRVIQILENAFNAEDNGITIEKIGGQAWGDYYTQLSTAFAGGDVPNVAVMHQHRLPDFAGRDLLMPLDDVFEASRRDRLRRLHRAGTGCSTRSTARSTRCRSTSTHRCGT